MENEKAFLVITAKVNKENMADVSNYLESVMPIFGKNGGKPFGRFKTVNKLTGDEGPEMVGIIEFQNADAITDLVKGEDFNSLSDLRTKAFKKLDMVITHEM